MSSSNDNNLWDPFYNDETNSSESLIDVQFDSVSGESNQDGDLNINQPSSTTDSSQDGTCNLGATDSA